MTTEQIATLVLLILILAFGIWAYRESISAKKE